MDNLERRVIVLEEQARHERELNDWRFDSLSRQLLGLQTRPQITAPSLAKILVAIAIPLTALLTTGDLRKVLMAIRLAVGG